MALRSLFQSTLETLPRSLVEQESLSACRASFPFGHLDLVISNAGVATRNHPVDPVLGAQAAEMMRLVGCWGLLAHFLIFHELFLVLIVFVFSNVVDDSCSFLSLIYCMCPFYIFSLSSLSGRQLLPANV